ncbi:MAG: DUF3298 domain-containing protein [Prevotella sp.]|nr:DUF3298 domain-containing protein [Prevotella sp.]
MRIKLQLFYSCIFTILLCACGGKKSTPALESEKVMDFSSCKKDTLISLTNSASSPKAEIQLLIHYATGKNAKAVNKALFKSGILTPDYISTDSVEREMKDAISLYVQKYAADYKKEYGDMFRRDPIHPNSYNIQYTCETSVKKGRKGVFNYLADVYYFGGGAHGVNSTIAKNIDMENGKILLLEDVFVAGYEDILKEKLVETLCRKYKAKDLNGLREKSIFMNMEPYITENFILGKSSITFIYTDTEIAPHSEGQIEAEIDYSDIDSVLR